MISKRLVRVLLYGSLFTAFATGIPAWFVYRVIRTEGTASIVGNEDLRNTVLSPHLEQAHVPGSNIIWCATFQLAWNEAGAFWGEEIRPEGNPADAAALNRKAVTIEDADDSACVAIAGRAGEGILDRIEKEVLDKFKGEFRPELDCSKYRNAGPDEIIAYAAMFKKLAFPSPFERLFTPVVFEGTDVQSFGFIDEPEIDYEALYKQVLIHDYRSKDDFVIEISTSSEKDELILAKIPIHGSTLQETVTAVASRMGLNKPEIARKLDVLKVPRMNFRINTIFEKLIGKLRTVKQTGRSWGIMDAVQDVRFSMDEKGVELKSEAVVHMGCGGRGGGKCIMVFDKPFLLMIRKRGRRQPYFAVWCEHPEILAKSR